MRWLAELDLLMAVDGYPSIADLRALRALNACDVSYWQILLQKSFCTRDQNFFWLYKRFSCKDVRDLIA
jgi:hypothetical protein